MSQQPTEGATGADAGANLSQADLATLVQDLDDVDYDRQRRELAKKHGVRVGTLDALRRGAPATAAGSSALVPADPEPWPTPVDGSSLLDDVCHVISRYVVLPEEEAAAAALWVVLTWVHDLFAISPYLAITSPQRGCGKTTLLAVLRRLVRRPLPASSITAAALYRTIEVAAPTLLIDEFDAQLKGDRSRAEELRGILNSGHLRDGAQVVRCVGEDHDPQAFTTWCPKALALIGRLPATLSDRCIEIRLEARAPDSSQRRLRADREDGSWLELRRRLTRWATDIAPFLRAVDDQGQEPTAPMSDRAVDNWRPPLAIAESTRQPFEEGCAWRDAGEAAAKKLSGSAQERDPGPMLLEDLRTIIGHAESMQSEAICSQLAELEHRPWPEWGSHDKPISQRQLASLLDRYGVLPQREYVDGQRLRCYNRADLEPVWGRYLLDGTRGTDGTDHTGWTGNG